MLLFAGAGNDLANGGTRNDNMRGELGDDILSGGYGDDRLDGGLGNDQLYGGEGTDRLIGGAGDDWLRSGETREGTSILTGGSGSDLFDYSLQTGGGTSDNPESEFWLVNDLISDFTVGQDKLHIASRVDNEAEGTTEFYEFKFSDLDTNGNGIVTDADEAVSINLMSFMGEQRFSLTIDFGQFHPNNGQVGSGTITLFGVTTLTAGDFA